MRRILSRLAASAVVTVMVAGCGGGGDGGGYGSGPSGLVSFVGTTGVFAAWANSDTGEYAVASIGTYAGKRQVLHGTVDFTTGVDVGQSAGVEVYKGNDGHIYVLDLTSPFPPDSQQLSSETAATVDDTCSLAGTQVSGANYDYVGVYFAADLQTPTNSSYFYRLPGADGVCNTADDVVHMVKTGMSATDAPVAVSAMPVATVRTAAGGIAGFVVKSGAQLLRVDANFANPVVMATFGAPIGVAVALPVGTLQGYPTAQLYVVDGSIYAVNYATASTSPALYTIAHWTTTNAGASFVASPTTLYFDIYTAASGSTPASTAILAMPADGSAAPTVIATEAGRVETLAFPVAGTGLVWGVANPNYTIRTMAQSGGAVTTLWSSSVNAGTFIATATTVYWTTWSASNNASTHVVTRSATSTGIVDLDGTVIRAPLTNSTFASGGEQLPWPADTTTTSTPYETVLQVQNLSPVTVTNPTTGTTYVADGVSGGTVVAIDTATNQTVATLGTVPVGNATFLTGTFRDPGHTGFVEATTSLSTNDPATRGLYLLNTHGANTLVHVIGNL